MYLYFFLNIASLNAYLDFLAFTQNLFDYNNEILNTGTNLPTAAV